MRRISRPNRSIDSFSPSIHILRCLILPSPRSPAPTAYACLRTSSASFSTSTARNSILSADKKKNQTFVRKWQKRLLGESEPIGSRVDPYDATSPIRISPEETGEEEEVLDQSVKDSVKDLEYKEADSGSELQWVGTEKHVKEAQLAETRDLFVKFTGVAPSGVRSFAPRNPITYPALLQKRFHQAVVEVFTLKSTLTETLSEPDKAKVMDVASWPGAKQEPPRWVSKVKIFRTEEGINLKYPHQNARGNLLQLLKGEAKTKSQSKPVEILEEPALVDPATQYTSETIDGSRTTPETAAAQVPEAVIVKPGKLVAVGDKKPFDFMSNRSTPRVVPEAPVPVVETIETVVEEVVPATTTVEVQTVTKAPQNKTAPPSEAYTRISASFHKTRKAIEKARYESSILTGAVTELKYHDVPLEGYAVKFAISKRLTQLTGHRIPDPILTKARTLADLYTSLHTISKPKPTKLVDQLILAAKTQHRQPKSTSHSSTHKPGMGSLLSLPNVKVYNRRVGKADKHNEVGRAKVIRQALQERGLPLFGFGENRLGKGENVVRA